MKRMNYGCALMHPSPSDLSATQGGWERDESLEMAAKRETYEEAGVRGALDGTPLGTFHFQSDKKERIAQRDRGACIALVHVMRVQEELGQWPEMTERRRRWVRVRECLDLCRHEWMRQALTLWVSHLSAREVDGGD